MLTLVAAETSRGATAIDVALAAPGPDGLEWDKSMRSWKSFRTSDPHRGWYVHLGPAVHRGEVLRQAQRIEAHSELLEALDEPLTRERYEEACRTLGAECFPDSAIVENSCFQSEPRYERFLGTTEEFSRGIADELGFRRFLAIDVPGSLEREDLRGIATGWDPFVNPRQGYRSNYLVRKSSTVSPKVIAKCQAQVDELLARLPSDALREQVRGLIEADIDEQMPVYRESWGLEPEGANAEHDAAAIHVRADYGTAVKDGWVTGVEEAEPLTPAAILAAKNLNQVRRMAIAALLHPAQPFTRESADAR